MWQDKSLLLVSSYLCTILHHRDKTRWWHYMETLHVSTKSNISSIKNEFTYLNVHTLSRCISSQSCREKFENRVSRTHYAANAEIRRFLIEGTRRLRYQSIVMSGRGWSIRKGLRVVNKSSLWKTVSRYNLVCEWHLWVMIKRL